MGKPAVRPLYESEENRKEELQTALSIAETWFPDNTCSFKQLPPKSTIDLAYNKGGEVIFFGEVKVRTTLPTTHADYMVSMEKWNAGCNLARNTKRPVYLFVRFFDNSVYYVPFKPEDNIFFTAGGRDDRGDPLDIEVCAFIPMSLFRPLSESPFAPREKIHYKR